MNNLYPCPLCSTVPERPYSLIQNRKLHSCNTCSLLYVDSTQHLSLADERARYEHHQNSSKDEAYCNFLNRLLNPLLEILPAGSVGLDYGCGPGPTVSTIMKKNGFSVANYDPFFFKQAALLERKYDFITCTEVVEHFFKVAKEMERLLKMLNPNGILAIMTEILEADTDLTEWYYLREPSHVCFFSSETMEWISQNYKLEMITPHKNVRFFKKSFNSAAPTASSDLSKT